MANSGDEIYAVHQCGGDCWEDAYDYVLAAFTSMPRAVSYIERDLGAYECSHGDSREWHRWSLCVFKGDEYEYWGPMDDSEDEDEDDLDDEDDDFEPTHPSRVTEFGTRRHFRARRASGLVHGRFLEQAQANQLGKRGAQPSACSANPMYKREKSAGHTADGRNGAVCCAPGPAGPSYPPVRLGCRHNSLPFAEKTAPSRVLLIVHLPFRNSLGVHFLNDCGGLCVCTAGLPGKRRPHPVDVLGPWGCPGSL